MPAAVIFDLDGVLIDSEQRWNGAKEALVGETGGRWREEAPARMMGMSSPEWAAYLRDDLAVPMEAEAINRHAVITLSFCDTPALVLGDAAQFQQVVLNLALNGLDAAGSSAHPHVVISTSVAADEVEIAVHDNGPGIPTDIREQVLEPFFTTKARGGGLGLPIAKRVAELHGGTLTLAFPAAGGTVVRLEAPTRPPSPTA